MKRILALLLCVMMCVSLIPAAYAEDLEVIDVVGLEEEAPVEEETVAGETPDGEDDLIAIVETETSTGDEKLASTPVITTQPKSKTAYVDTTASFHLISQPCG